MKGLGMIHIFMAAYTRVVSQLPGINRFIRGQRVFARNNIEICMAIKKELKLNAPETVVKLDLTPQDTLCTIYNQLTDELEKNKETGDNNSMDSFARILVAIPGIFLKLTIWFIKLFDYFGWLPRWLTKLSPFHGSMFITNMGSLGMPPIYHHLYDFGTLPVFIAFGAKRHAYELDRHGEMVDKKYVDLKFVLDEGTVDGHHYSQFLQALRYIFQHPEIVETPPSRVNEDIF